MKYLPAVSSSKNPVKFRILTGDNLVPIRIDIESDGQRFRDAFTWNPSDPDSKMVVFAKRTVKDLKLPVIFVTLIAQTIHSQVADFRALEGQDMHIGEKIVPIKVSMDQNKAVSANATPNWTINVSDIRTVKVTNISVDASEKDIKEFFSFSGDIQHVEMRRENETSQVAYISFKETQGADAALSLAGSTIADLSVTITPVENYQLPPDAPPLYREARPAAIRKAEDVMSSVLAKGYVLGKEVVNKAKSLDERHNLTSKASATISSIDSKIGLSEKINMGTNVVNGKVREIDEKLKVYEKTKTAFAVAEQKASVVMSSPLLSTGASWFTSAYEVVSKAAEDVSSMTKDKVSKVEGEMNAEVKFYQEGASSVVNQDFGDHVNNDEKRLEII